MYVYYMLIPCAVRIEGWNERKPHLKSLFYNQTYTYTI